MNAPARSGEPTPAEEPPKRVGLFGAMAQIFRTRVVSGLIAALPIALTFFIVNWLYVTAIAVLTPLIEAVRSVLGNRGYEAEFWYRFVAPAIAVLLVLCFLYLLGLFVRTRLLRSVDWVMLHLPVVGTIFKAVNNVFQSLSSQLQGDQGFKRVVLVEFPHPGIKSLAFVTNTLSDATTGRPIYCVCVLTGVMPPAGFTLFVPAESVTDVDWSMNQTIQAILSGGITTPSTVHYFRGTTPTPHGPIIDAQGHPIGGVVREPDEHDHP